MSAGGMTACTNATTGWRPVDSVRAATGHAAAAPGSVMNSRRVMTGMGPVNGGNFAADGYRIAPLRNVKALPDQLPVAIANTNERLGVDATSRPPSSWVAGRPGYPR